MAEIILTKENFEEEVLNSTTPVLVDFWAVWCGPCRMLAPILEEIGEEHADTLKIGKINVDEQPELAAAYHIVSIPTVMLFKDGKMEKKSIGYVPKAELEALLK